MELLVSWKSDSKFLCIECNAKDVPNYVTSLLYFTIIIRNEKYFILYLLVFTDMCEIHLISLPSNVTFNLVNDRIEITLKLKNSCSVAFDAVATKHDTNNFNETNNCCRSYGREKYI